MKRTCDLEPPVLGQDMGGLLCLVPIERPFAQGKHYPFHAARRNETVSLSSDLVSSLTRLCAPRLPAEQLIRMACMRPPRTPSLKISGASTNNSSPQLLHLGFSVDCPLPMLDLSTEPTGDGRVETRGRERGVHSRVYGGGRRHAQARGAERDDRGLGAPQPGRHRRG